MKFVPTKQYTYPWPVKLVIPDEEKAGEVKTEEFTAIFRLLLDTESNALVDDLRGATKATDYAEATKKQIRLALVGWKSETMPMPFSAEALEAYMAFPFFRDGVVNAIAESLAKRPILGN
jgi:hypothetical protein